HSRPSPVPSLTLSLRDRPPVDSPRTGVACSHRRGRITISATFLARPSITPTPRRPRTRRRPRSTPNRHGSTPTLCHTRHERHGLPRRRGGPATGPESSPTEHERSPPFGVLATQDG